jgi:hypothetical protein
MSKLGPPVNVSVPVQSAFTVYVPGDALDWVMLPLMLTVANGLISVPSPLKSIPSTMAKGRSPPATGHLRNRN